MELESIQDLLFLHLTGEFIFESKLIKNAIVVPFKYENAEKTYSISGHGFKSQI